MNSKQKLTLFFCALASAALIQAAPVDAEQSSGFGLAWAVFIFLALMLVYALVRVGIAGFQGLPAPTIPAWQSWAVPILAVVGLGVAGYLTYVETTMVAAVCGPVGDCNAVQSSSYARMFGVLPVALLGVGGYVAILIAWGGGRFRQDRLARLVPPALYGMTFLGVLYSLYLTYLELYVLHAVCLWCISSAIIMGLLLVLSTTPMLGFLAWDDEDEEQQMGIM
jgi:uncharacterized membrane protein